MKKIVVFGLLILGIVAPVFVLAPYNNKLYTGLAPFGEDFPSRNWKENFGQLLIIGFEGTEVTPALSKLMEEVRPGGILLLGRNIVNKEQTKKLIQDLQELSMRNTGVPLFVAVDQEGGIVSRIPWADTTSQSDLKDFQHAFLVGQKRAQALKEVGINMNLAPVLDSNSNKDFLFSRSFQKDPQVSLELAKGLIEGQKTQSVIAVPKHVPGYDGISFNPEDGILPHVKNFPSTSLFQNVFQSSPAPFLMISHVVYQEVDSQDPLPLSGKGMQLLKQEMGEHVLLMSDDLSSRSLMRNYSFADIGKSALQGGVNVLLVGGYPDASVVGEFYGAMKGEFAKEQFSYTAGVGRLYEILFGQVQNQGDLQSLVTSSAAKILEAKKVLLSEEEIL